jgi:hypothetical protein
MPEEFARMKRGEKRPLYGFAVAESGTLTISGSPAPSFTCYDSTGTPVAGLSGLTATGYDAGAAAAPRAWHVLDTATPVDLPAGYYTLVFTIRTTGSDGLARIHEPSILLQVVEVDE